MTLSASPPVTARGRAFLVAALGCSVFAVSAFALSPSQRLTQYVHRIWQTEQGLPDAMIGAVRQTAEGYIWLGTYSGLVRFDGVRFLTIEGPGRILENVWIRSLGEDSEGGLWLGTNGAGLVRLQQGRFAQYTEKTGLPSNVVYCAVPSRHGGVWACTANGIALLRKGRFQVYARGDGLPDNMVFAACESKDGTLWAGSEYSQVSSWNGAGFQVHRLNSVPRNTPVRALLSSDEGSLWIGTSKGLIQLKDGQERLFTVASGLGSNFVNSLSQSRDGTLWIGTQRGFSRFRNGAIESFRPEDGLSQRMVHAICEDREGSLWVGTMHGLDQFLDGRSTRYTAREGLPSNNTGPIIQDRHGNILVGTFDNGLGRLEGDHFTTLARRESLSHGISAFAEDGQGRLWVGASAGLVWLSDGQVRRTLTVDDGLPSNVVHCLFRDHSGALWVGTDSGPARLQNGAFVQPAVLRQTLAAPITAIGEDHQGRLYFGTDHKGVYSYVDGEVPRPLPTGDSPPTRAAELYTDQDGLLWIATIGNGLKLVRNGTITAYVTRDGLLDNSVFGIIQDTPDRMWLACAKGIFVVSRAQLLQFADGKIRSLVSRPVDLMQSIECPLGAQPIALDAHDGSLWFSTSRGVIAFDPNRLTNQATPPEAVIEGVIVNGERFEPQQIKRISSGPKNLEFQYTGLSFLEPSRITFRYMMEGFDKEWTKAGTRREAIYTNLPPGAFRFRVTACRPDGVCSETGSSMDLVLTPSLYQQKWFLPMCAALLALMAWLVHCLQVRRLREQMDLVLAERNRIARELHDTLIQGFSGLTLQMQALAARLHTSGERATLEEIIRDAGAYLRETRQSVAGLRTGQQSNQRLVSAIADSARHVAAECGVRLRLKLDDKAQAIPAEVEYNVLRIAQEAIANSIRHSGARNLEVLMELSPTRVRLAVKDDGSGFVVQGPGDRAEGHYGLIGMRERAVNIGGRFEILTAPGKGTTVSVEAPISRSVNHPSSANNATRESHEIC